MPRTIGGIPGFSMWNFLIINVTLAWISQRRSQGLVWDLPRVASVVLFLFIGTVFISFLRVLVDPTQYIAYTTPGIINEAFVNSLKFMLPFYMFFDGCRTQERTRAAFISIVTLYFLLAVLVIKHMGLHGADDGADLNGRGAKLIHASTGYHRVDMAMMLAGAAWGMMAAVSILMCPPSIILGKKPEKQFYSFLGRKSMPGFDKSRQNLYTVEYAAVLRRKLNSGVERC